MDQPVTWRQRRKRAAPIGLVLIGSLAVSIVSGYLIAHGLWVVVIGLLIAVPGFIILHRDPWLAILAWVIVSPFLVIDEFTLIRRVYWVIHRGLPPLALLVIFAGHILGIRRRKFPRPGLSEAAMGLYLLVTLLSVLFQSNSPLATAYVVYDRIFVPMCLYAILRIQSPDARDLDRLVWAAFFIAVSQAIFGVLYWGAPGLLPSGWLGEHPRATGSVRSVGLYTVLLIFAGMLVLQKGMQTDSFSKKAILVSAFVLSLVGVVVSYSRGSWLGGLLVLLVLFRLYPRVVSGVVIAGVVSALLAAGLLTSQIRFAQERLASENTALSRLPVMYASVQMTAARPMFGWGYGNFNDYDRQFQGRVGELVSPGEKDQSSHNFFLSTLAEQGLVGFFLMIFPAVWYALATIRLMSDKAAGTLSERNGLILLWLIILNIFIVHNFLDMIIPYAHGLYWLTLGLIAVRIRALEDRRVPSFRMVSEHFEAAF